MRQTQTMRRSARLASLLALLAACGSDPAEDTRPRGALPRSHNLDGSYSVQLMYYQGPPCGGSSSVAATGPGPAPDFATTTVALACSSGTWGTSLDVGVTHATAPTRYDFEVVDGGATRQETGSVPCYRDLPVPLAPGFGDTVPTPVTFTWALLAGTGNEFTVYVGEGDQAPLLRKSVVDGTSLSFPLAPGTYAGWSLEVIGVGGYEPTSPHRCSARATTGPMFHVTAQ